MFCMSSILGVYPTLTGKAQRSTHVTNTKPHSLMVPIPGPTCVSVQVSSSPGVYVQGMIGSSDWEQVYRVHTSAPRFCYLQSPPMILPHRRGTLVVKLGGEIRRHPE